MAATTCQMAAPKKERLPTEWALCEGDESEAGQELPLLEDARPANPRCSIVGRPRCTREHAGMGRQPQLGGSPVALVGGLVRDWRVE